MYVVNDVHSRLNPTRVRRVEAPETLEALLAAIQETTAQNLPISLSGGRHAMGGQQFGTDTLHLDLSGLKQVRAFDAERGLITVESGMQWPDLVGWLRHHQPEDQTAWTITQKPTGADTLSMGGCLSANIHGRGLAFRPFIQDIESFTLIMADGQRLQCSREENGDLFRLAIGGYGLFGVVETVTLRLSRFQKLRRTVRMMTVSDLIPAFDQAMAEGARYGDFQFAIDHDSDDFLHRGIWSVYGPVPLKTAIPPEQKTLSLSAWQELVWLAHTDKQRAFEAYAAHYLATDGQVYRSDTHQLSTYLADYHGPLNARLMDAGLGAEGSEVITELYVPRPCLEVFMGQAAAIFRRRNTSVIYGTVRLIEADPESFLPWANASYACIIFNLHTPHTSEGIEASAGTFRALIDAALALGGSFYLTYHRFATREQIRAAYPQFPEFLAEKLRLDPAERFQSDWYCHYRTVFGS